MGLLADRVAVVTGGGDIGAAVVRGLRQHGADVTLWDRLPHVLEGLPEGVTGRVVDVTSDSEVASATDATIDAKIEEALRTVDDAKRQDLLAKATELAMESVAIIPTHFQVNTWAAKKGLRYVARTDEYTLAIGVVKE